MKKLMVANWKMNNVALDCIKFFEEFTASFSGKREAWVAPQALHLALVKSLGEKHHVLAGLQNCSAHVSGAFTGENSPRSLKALGGEFVILGHSERRQYFGETSRDLHPKVRTALREGLKVIYCVGETLQEREGNETLAVIATQLHQGLSDLGSLATADNLIVAYEPVWAIGTGKTATPAQAQEVHAFIRQVLAEKFLNRGDRMRILYGGSVKPDNVEELLSQPDIDGGLVGGAALKARDFLALCGDK
jgi:triosephosphate isomerase